MRSIDWFARSLINTYFRWDRIFSYTSPPTKVGLIVIPPISEKDIRNGLVPLNAHPVLNPVTSVQTALDNAVRSVLQSSVDIVYVAAAYPTLELVRMNIPDSVIVDGKKKSIFWISTPYAKNNIVDITIRAIESIYFSFYTFSKILLPTSIFLSFANIHFDILPYVEKIDKRIKHINYSSLFFEKDGKNFTNGILLPAVLSNLDIIRFRRQHKITEAKKTRTFKYLENKMVRPYYSIQVDDYYDSNNLSEIFRYHQNNENFIDKIRENKEMKFLYKNFDESDKK